jgi:hypothetical protein
LLWFLTSLNLQKNEVVWIAPPSPLVMWKYYGVSDQARAFIANGGSMRGILTITPPYIELARNLMDIGATICHVEGYSRVFFIVGDRKESLSSVIVNPEALSYDGEVIAFWGNGPTYAEYLLSIFENVWTQGLDAQERIDELLQEG